MRTNYFQRSMCQSFMGYLIVQIHFHSRPTTCVRSQLTKGKFAHIMKLQRISRRYHQSAQELWKPKHCKVVRNCILMFSYKKDLQLSSSLVNKRFVSKSYFFFFSCAPFLALFLIQYMQGLPSTRKTGMYK